MCIHAPGQLGDEGEDSGEKVEVWGRSYGGVGSGFLEPEQPRIVSIVVKSKTSWEVAEVDSVITSMGMSIVARFEIEAFPSPLSLGGILGGWGERLMLKMCGIRQGVMPLQCNLRVTQPKFGEGKKNFEPKAREKINILYTETKLELVSIRPLRILDDSMAFFPK